MMVRRRDGCLLGAFAVMMFCHGTGLVAAQNTTLISSSLLTSTSGTVFFGAKIALLRL